MSETPTAEELDKVARYWVRVKALTCEHPELTFENGSAPTCGKCQRPIRMMSDIQIEELRR